MWKCDASDDLSLVELGRPTRLQFGPVIQQWTLLLGCLDLTLIKKIVKKRLPNVFHQILLLYVQYIYGYIIITVFMDIQKLSNFFSAG